MLYTGPRWARSVVKFDSISGITWERFGSLFVSPYPQRPSSGRTDGGGGSSYPMGVPAFSTSSTARDRLGGPAGEMMLKYKNKTFLVLKPAIVLTAERTTRAVCGILAREN